MLYEKVTKRCSAVRLSREEARESLTSQFTDSEILDLKRRGDKWVATLLMPKEAEFPPKKDDDDAGSKEEGDGGSEKSEGKDDSSKSDGDGGEGPPKADKPPHPGQAAGGLEHAVAELTTMVHAIAEAMGVAPAPAVPGADDMGMEGGPMPDGPPPPHGHPGGPEGGGGPPGGPPGGGPPGHQEIVHRTKMHPGDTPPGVTPIGAPAFSSVHTAQLQRVASFDAFDDTPNKSVKVAKEELEALYGPHGFKVRQIKRVENGQRLAAKLSRR